jgi:hypothetical protein
MNVFKELIEAINKLPSMKVEPKKNTTTKNILDFFNVQDSNDMWSGMRCLGHPIRFYVGYSAGWLRALGCVIPSDIPDEATIVNSATDLYYFGWYRNGQYLFSEKIVL